MWGRDGPDHAWGDFADDTQVDAGRHDVDQAAGFLDVEDDVVPHCRTSGLVPGHGVQEGEGKVLIFAGLRTGRQHLDL